MGNYLNPGSGAFHMALNSRIYVDKSGLISKTNALINTMQRYVCISRPRRFGKSMAMDMLSSYYGCGEDTRAIFDKLSISKHASFAAHINKYNVIKLNIQTFLSATKTVDAMIEMIRLYLLSDITAQYPDAKLSDTSHLARVMQDICAHTRRPFIILIDEWDCLFREYAQDKQSQKQYLDFLRAWLKDQEYVALAYMTGILPIKKYGTHSALNMFTEYSMINPRDMAEYFGFTEREVKALCDEFGMSYEEARAWYDGYELVSMSVDGRTVNSMYSPKSVVDAMLSHAFDTYWNQTETYEALKVYIQLNHEGLKDAVVKMLAGDVIEINTGTFSNDMTTLKGRDDVLTLLTHLGYLNYHWANKTVRIPNKEVSQEYINAVSTMSWGEVKRAVDASRKLLTHLWALDADAVAAGIDRAHNEISVLRYNDENSLSCAITLAFYYAREYYTIIRELPAGKGFADICLIPRKLHADKPAAIIELKWNASASGAIAQIKRREYVSALDGYAGDIILAGINYDSKLKAHSCIIEKLTL